MNVGVVFGGLSVLMSVRVYMLVVKSVLVLRSCLVMVWHVQFAGVLLTSICVNNEWCPCLPKLPFV